jgi:hypothetical protein
LFCSWTDCCLGTGGMKVEEFILQLAATAGCHFLGDPQVRSQGRVRRPVHPFALHLVSSSPGSSRTKETCRAVPLGVRSIGMRGGLFFFFFSCCICGIPRGVYWCGRSKMPGKDPVVYNKGLPK